MRQFIGGNLSETVEANKLLSLPRGWEVKKVGGLNPWQVFNADGEPTRYMGHTPIQALYNALPDVGIKMSSQEIREICGFSEDNWKSMSSHEKGKYRKHAVWLKKIDYRCSRCKMLVDPDDRHHFNGLCTPAKES